VKLHARCEWEVNRRVIGFSRMAPERIKLRHAGTEWEGPIDGPTCPACGNAGSVFREVTRERYSYEQALADEAGGLHPFLMMLLTGDTVRLRCAQCDCRFPAPLSRAAKLLIALLALAAAGGIGFLAVTFRAPIASWIMSQWRANPIIFVAAASVVGSTVLMVALVRLHPGRHRDKHSYDDARQDPHAGQ
jgi:hypothetical protein